MNIIRYSIQSFFTNEYYSIIRFASKRLFVATLSSQHIGGGGGASNNCSALGVKEMMVQISIIFASAPSLIYHSFVLHLPIFSVKIFVQI